MKCYTDLAGTIEAKPGDRVARVDHDVGPPLFQADASRRPIAVEDKRGELVPHCGHDEEMKP